MERALEGAVVNVCKEESFSRVNTFEFEGGDALSDGVMQNKAEKKCGKAFTLEKAISDVEYS